MAADSRSNYVEKLADRVKLRADDPAGQDVRTLLGQTPLHMPADSAALSQELERRPDLQAKLAKLIGYTPSRWLLECELEEINKRRDVFNIEAVPPAAEPPARAFRGGLIGLCCSGGGIRSATFSLGVLQALAELNLLRSLDYLSSVSGGGYIHQWLAAWLRRESQGRTGTSTTLQAFDAINQQLIPPPDPTRDDPHPKPLQWLRRYSNYLTPRRGIFSGDTWAAVAIWLRNTLLNQVILISGLLFLLLVPHLLAPPSSSVGLALSPSPVALARAGRLAVGVLVLLVMVPTFFAASNLFAVSPSGEGSRLLDERGVQFYIVLPMLGWAVLWTVLQDSIWVLPLAWLLFLVFGLAIAFGGAALNAYVSIHTVNGSRRQKARDEIAVRQE